MNPSDERSYAASPNMTLHRGLAVRGVAAGLGTLATIVMPHSQQYRWWAIYSAIGVFVIVGILLAIVVRQYPNDERSPAPLAAIEIFGAYAAITLASIGAGGVEGNHHFLLLLVLMISASHTEKGLAAFGWIGANVSLVASASAAGIEAEYVFTLAFNFATVSAAVTSVMVFIRTTLAASGERATDLAYLAAVSARAESIRAAIDESGDVIRRISGAERVVLSASKPRDPRDGDYWICLGETGHTSVYLALLDAGQVVETDMAAISDIFRPVVARDGLFADLHAMTRTDSLSGLANRRALDEFLDRHCADRGSFIGLADRRCEGMVVEPEDVTVVLLDLDHFKQYNDVQGHLAGDQVLRDFGMNLQLALRGSDLAARYGGEEFCLVLLGATTTAVNIVGRIRERWTEEYPGVRFSAGVANWDYQETAQDLLARSDEALYESKERGRDRITVAPLPATALPNIDGS